MTGTDLPEMQVGDAVSSRFQPRPDRGLQPPIGIDVEQLAMTALPIRPTAASAQLQPRYMPIRSAPIASSEVAASASTCR
jgi:hypothetical protein